MNRIRADLHSHSSYSPDAKDSLEAMYQRAEELGLGVYAVTDHCECNFWYPTEHYFPGVPEEEITDHDMYDSGRRALESIAAQFELREKYLKKLDILVGIELGQTEQAPELARIIAGDERVDLIIGSHHMNRGRDDFYYLDYGKLTIEENERLLYDCFNETLEMCRLGCFDILGHLTYPLRYMTGEYGIKPDMGRYDEVIAEIFRTLAQNGKGIEVNSSGLRQRYGRTFPELRYIKLFRDLGGEFISVGSDAHCTADLGKGTEEATALIAAAGFERLTYYKRRKPEFIEI
ncbi:MAG: histidinol-phosphatase HisJ family protein [Ruminococcus sp.]|nr:histidinol-phosphatase HisJ family protein [Ruminococcus sp.]